jgi:carbonic anhydrase
MSVSRRRFLQGVGTSAGALAAAALVPEGLTDAFAASTPATPTMTPNAALRRLAAGNKRFVNGTLRHPRRDGKRRAALAEGQAPYAVVLGCADSRVPPEIIYDEGLGSIFTVRVAGNSGADPLVVGSIEYSISVLGSAVVVVLGHQECGAVKAAIDVAKNGTQLPGDLPAVVAPIVPVVQLLSGTPDDELLDAVIKANVHTAVAQLSASDLIASAIAAGTVKVVGREYLLKSGRVVSVL